MKHHAPLFALILLSLPSGYALAAESPAPEYRRSSLVERTPFAKNERGPVRASSGGPLELRGFFGSGKDMEVSLTRPDNKESAWVRVGDTTSKWFVESADPDAGTAEVRYDGLRLHLTLARPEEVTMTPPAPAPVKVEEPNRGRNRGGRMSAEARDAMRTIMRENMERARKEHPEYFDGSKLTEDQEKARSEYFRLGYEKARAAAVKISPEDSAGAAPAPAPSNP